MRRSSMTLFSDPGSHYSHRVRIVLAEKGVTVDIEDFDSKSVTQEILEANPYGTLPTLVDRDLALYESKVIMEYLDERFPHPPLLPVYLLHELEVDCGYTVLKRIGVPLWILLLLTLIPRNRRMLAKSLRNQSLAFQISLLRCLSL